MADVIEKIEKRTVQYYFSDGIPEMAWSVVALLMALYFLGLATAPANSPWTFVLDVGLLPLFLFGGWAVNKVTRTLKRKLTYPRTGYVSYRKPEGKRRVRRAALAGGVAGVFGALLAFALSRGSGDLARMPLLSGLAFAPVFIFLAGRAGAPRLYILGAVSAAAGIALALSGWGDLQGLAAFYGIVAAALFVSGFIACRRYLRENPLPGGAAR